MNDSSHHNALRQICRNVNKQCAAVDKTDIKTITEILHREYRQIEQLFPEVSYFKFKSVLGQINGQYPERD